MKRIVLISLLVLFATLPLAAQDKKDGFIARTYRNNHREKMPYRLFIPPGYDKSKKYPLIVWLHGAGGAGNDNTLQIIGDQIAGTHLWTRPENQERHPAFVLVPQSPGAWADINGPQLPDEERLVLEILDSVKKDYGIDSKRIYIAGQSNGGFGVWDMISKRTEVFAAAIPLCGGGNPIMASKLLFMPIWAFHGDKDDVIPVSYTRNMIAEIKRLGGKPRYTEYKGADHNIWNLAFAEPGMVDWLFAQHN